MRLFALCLLVLCAAPAHADPHAQQTRLINQAAKAYGDGHYAEAAELLEKARALGDSGRIVYNLARAYEKAGDVDKSIKAYETYVDRADAEKPIVAKARAALARLYKEIGKREAAAEAPPPGPTASPGPAEPEPVTPPPPTSVQSPAPAAADAPVAAPAPVVVAPEPAPAAVVTAPAPSRGPPGLRIAGAAVLVLGVLGLATGGGFGIWAEATAGQLHATTDATLKPQLRDAALFRAQVADYTFVAAGVVAALGLTLLLLGLKS